MRAVAHLVARATSANERTYGFCVVRVDVGNIFDVSVARSFGSGFGVCVGGAAGVAAAGGTGGGRSS